MIGRLSAVNAEAAGFALEVADLLQFSGSPSGPGLSLRRIVVPLMAACNGPRSVECGAGEAPQGVVRDLELIALADQDPERAIALTRRLGRSREAALEQR